jgi:O-antigen/teichoic acid export membrane protein
MLLLFPAFLTQEQIGLTRALIDTSLTLASLCSLGALPVIYKFAPFYNDYLETKKNDLPFITFIVNIIGFILVLACGYLFRNFIMRKFGGKSPEFAQYFFYVFPFTFLLMVFNWEEAFAWGLRKTVITSFLKETSIRVLTSVLILLYAVHCINFSSFIISFNFLYLLPVIVLLLLLLKTGKWVFKIQPISFVTRRLKKRMISFALFIFGAQFLNVLAKTNDTFLILGLRGLSDTGVFAIALYITAVLEIPQRSMNAISIPILAESWKNKDFKNISDIYTKSVSNLLVIGLGLFGIIWLNVHNLTFFLDHLTHKGGQNYKMIEPVVLIIGIAKIIDLGTGINSQIIGTSNYWRFDFYTNVFYTVFSIPLNFVLIKYCGLTGLAFSNLFALVLYNSIRYTFLWKKFNLQPYTYTHLRILLAAVIIYLLIYILPQSPNIYLDTAIRSIIFMILFVSAVYITRAAPDLTSIVNKKIGKVLHADSNRT